MVKFFFSCSASWSVLLVSSVVLDCCGFALLPAVAAVVPAVGPLFYFLLIVHRPVLVLVSPAGSRCDCSPRFTSGNVLCSSFSSQASALRRVVHPSTC